MATSARGISFKKMKKNATRHRANQSAATQESL
jgi:hypothetical protein